MRKDSKRTRAKTTLSSKRKKGKVDLQLNMTEIKEEMEENSIISVNPSSKDVVKAPRISISNQPVSPKRLSVIDGDAKVLALIKEELLDGVHELSPENIHLEEDKHQTKTKNPAELSKASSPHVPTEKQAKHVAHEL